MKKQESIQLARSGGAYRISPNAVWYPTEALDKMVRFALGNETRGKFGNVEFWIEQEGPWAGQLSYDPPTHAWDRAALVRDLTHAICTTASRS